MDYIWGLSPPQKKIKWLGSLSITLPPINMEPDVSGVLEDDFPSKGPLSGSMLIGGRVPLKQLQKGLPYATPYLNQELPTWKAHNLLEVLMNSAGETNVSLLRVPFVMSCQAKKATGTPPFFFGAGGPPRKTKEKKQTTQQQAPPSKKKGQRGPDLSHSRPLNVESAPTSCLTGRRSFSSLAAAAPASSPYLGAGPRCIARAFGSDLVLVAVDPPAKSFTLCRVSWKTHCFPNKLKSEGPTK